MSFAFNNVVIGGTMTRDIEVTFTPKGTAVGNFALAINRTWYDDQDQKHEEVSFVEIQVWGRKAEVLAEHAGKGHSILINGHLKQDTWDDKQTGQKRSKLFVVLDEFQFVRKPRTEGEEGEKPQRGQPSREQQTQYRQQSAPPAKRPPLRDPDLDPDDGDNVPY